MNEPENTALRSFIIEQLFLTLRKKNEQIHLYVTKIISVVKSNICKNKMGPKTVLFKRYLKTKILFRIHVIREN